MYPFCTLLKVLLKAFHRKKVMAKTGKGIFSDLSTSLGHNKVITMTLQRQQKHKNDNEDKSRTNLGQAEDRKRTCKGPNQQKVQLYQIFFTYSPQTWATNAHEPRTIFELGLLLLLHFGYFCLRNSQNE